MTYRKPHRKKLKHHFSVSKVFAFNKVVVCFIDKMTTIKTETFDVKEIEALSAQFKDVKIAQEAYDRYMSSFLDEIKEHLNSNITLRDGREVLRKDDILYKIRKMIAMNYQSITVPFFNYYSSSFGTKDTKAEVAMKQFKDGETFYDAALRLGYHELCKPIDDDKSPPPKYCVYDKTDLKYKIAEFFGPHFTVFKKWRPIENFKEEFGKRETIRTWEVTLFLKFHADEVSDADW